MTSVRMEQISKKFGAVTALADIDLTIDGGELFFLLGPSGCGKSTLLRLVAGLHEPTTGRIFFNDRDVTPLPTEKRNAVMCFQSYALWPHMTVEDNIRFGLDVRGIDRAARQQRVAEVLKLVQMEPYARRKPNELSGGQQQRVALARALVVKPDCLLLDEPLSNLDARLRLEMRSEIRRICRSAGLTAIYVTHDQKEALSIADRMAVLNAGKIEQIGRPQDLYLRPANRFVAHFMGETNFLDGTIESANGSRVMVKTPIGTLASDAVMGPAKTGDAVSVSLRPEAIRLGDASTNGTNRFDAMLHDTMYLGEVAQHQVTVGGDNGTTLRAFELNPRVVARDEARQAVTASVAPGDVVVLVR